MGIMAKGRRGGNIPFRSKHPAVKGGLTAEIKALRSQYHSARTKPTPILLTRWL